MRKSTWSKSTLGKRLRYILESLSTAYLSLNSHINTFDKNYRCFEKLIKISYDPHKPFLAYFNKLHEEAYKKKTQKNLYGKLKLVVLMTKMFL